MTDRSDLRADCSRCAGLCCVALPFAASADFAIDKPAGRPCPHLQADSRCAIHAELRRRGFPGCTAYDCFGAGQQVVQVSFGGRDWRHDTATAALMFDAFVVLQQLHELRWLLVEAAEVAPTEQLRADAHRLRDRVRGLADAPPETLPDLDVPALRDEVGRLLERVSTAVRAGERKGRRERGTARHRRLRRGADLAGADLRDLDLRGADLRGAVLLAADLRGADLTRVDLLGSDLRGADLCGADLGRALFLTPPQVAAARGDARTRLPDAIPRPAHWPAGVPATR